MRRTDWCAYDFGIFVLYFSFGRDIASPVLYRRLLEWVAAIRKSLPARCEVLFLVDGNAHVGLLAVSYACGRALIGDHGQSRRIGIAHCCVSGPWSSIFNC